MTIRLHALYPIADGTPVNLRANEIAALRADAGAAPDDDLVFDLCYVCSECTLVSQTPGGTGTTAANYRTALGPLCQALLAQIGSPVAPTTEFIQQCVFGNRYIATSVK